MKEALLVSKPVLPRVSLAHSVYETLLEAIIGGQIKSGAELNSVALAQQLGVSRTPVQEAIRRLETDGLVVNPLGRTARVTEFTANDVREVYEMRMVLESAAASLAANNIAQADLATLRVGAEELARSFDDVAWGPRAIDYDIRFHQAIAEATGNARLRDDIGRYRRLVRGFCYMTGTEENLRAAFGEHLAILSALEIRDAEASRAAMGRHIECRLQAVLTTYFLQE